MECTINLGATPFAYKIPKGYKSWEDVAMDEQAAKKANRKYMQAVRKYRLHKQRDGWGNDTKRYMSDACFAGFYAGRDYMEQKVCHQTGTDSIAELVDAFNMMKRERQGAKDAKKPNAT